MFGSYLKVGGSGGGKPGQRYSREQSKATASTKCQKCLQMGHFTADCKGQRQYAVRPTRTQILKNPKLATKLTASLPPALEPKEGTAAAILAANEAKRAKLAAEAATKSSKSKESRRGRSRSSSAAPNVLNHVREVFKNERQAFPGQVAQYKTTVTREAQEIEEQIATLEGRIKDGGRTYLRENPRVEAKLKELKEQLDAAEARFIHPSHRDDKLDTMNSLGTSRGFEGLHRLDATYGSGTAHSVAKRHMRLATKGSAGRRY
ncbi:hypothetical protein JCM16303_000970 [Sporobolomyces ruberrimus]